MCTWLPHVQNIWAAAHGERICCIREPLNANDRYAVALKKDGAMIEHLPQKYHKYARYLLEEEEQLSVLSQVQEDTYQIYRKEGSRFHAAYYLVVRRRKLIKSNSYIQRK